MLDSLVNCKKCERITNNFSILRKKNPSHHNAPVPGRGNVNASLCIVGLAPGLHGANKTGKTFTNDFCSQILNTSLIDNNFYDETHNEKFYITNTLKCFPPKNKPITMELKCCEPFLKSEILSMKNLKIILVLGRLAHNSIIKLFTDKKHRYPFKHGAIYKLDNYYVFDSYHCSRLNINTKRLTIDSLNLIIKKIYSQLYVD